MGNSSIEGMITYVYDYHLTRGKLRREMVPSQRDDYVHLGCYVLNVTEAL